MELWLFMREMREDTNRDSDVNRNWAMQSIMGGEGRDEMMTVSKRVAD